MEPNGESELLTFEVTMPTFTPPTTEGNAWLHPRAKGAEKELMKFFSTCPMGKTVWRDLSDVWHEETYSLDIYVTVSEHSCMLWSTRDHHQGTEHSNTP